MNNTQLTYDHRIVVDDFEISEYGNKYWSKDGEWHREDGPAIEYTNGDKYWYVNGKAHREDGPAVETDTLKVWKLFGRFHREDGPAVERNDGVRCWYLDDYYYGEEKPVNWDELVNKYRAERLCDL
jgi:hypothetical protein